MPKSVFMPIPILFGEELLIVASFTSLGGKHSLVLMRSGSPVCFVVIFGGYNLVTRFAKDRLVHFATNLRATTIFMANSLLDPLRHSLINSDSLPSTLLFPYRSEMVLTIGLSSFFKARLKGLYVDEESAKKWLGLASRDPWDRRGFHGLGRGRRTLVVN